MKALKRMYTYMMKLTTMPPARIPHIAWRIGEATQKTKNSKFLTLSLVQDTRKWFEKWNVREHVDMHLEQGEEGECMLKFDMALLHSLHLKWKNTPHGSKWEY